MSYLVDINYDKNYSKLKSLLVENDCAVPDENGFLYLPTQFCAEFVDSSTSSSTSTNANEDNGEKIENLLKGDSDLIPNEYEGGFKIWEGLVDIVRYLKGNPNFLEDFSKRESLNILDVSFA